MIWRSLLYSCITSLVKILGGYPINTVMWGESTIVCYERSICMFRFDLLGFWGVLAVETHCASIFYTTHLECFSLDNPPH
jgi:hypothetical protein